jgi:GT2 family glycosyltransferase
MFTIKDNFARLKEIPVIAIKENYDSQLKYTIGITTYKRTEDLKMAIDSAIHQNGDIRVNIMVVDNNPERNDETEKLLATIEHPRLSYYKNSENVGMMGNMNRLFELSHTPYLIMLHDDDCLLPNFALAMDQILQKEKDVSAIGSDKFILHNSNMTKYCGEGKLNGKYRRVKPVSLYETNDFGVPSGTLYKVADVIKIGGYSMDTESEYFMSNDKILTLKMLLNGMNLLFLRVPLLKYRCGVNTSSHINAPKGWAKSEYLLHQELGKIFKFPKWFINITARLSANCYINLVHKMGDKDYEYKGLKGQCKLLSYIKYCESLVFKFYFRYLQ